MRFRRLNLPARGDLVTFRFDGRPITAYAGETVQAALLAAGIVPLVKNKTHHLQPGIFCGMGICYECLVTINGQPDQRACMRLVEADMEVCTDAAGL